MSSASEKCREFEMKTFIAPSVSRQSLDAESIMDIEDYEHTPLDCELPVELVQGKKSQGKKNNGGSIIAESWRGPLKAIRLFLLVAVMPTLFIFTPLYVRYNVFSGQLYPVGMSDMRLIDKKVSTTWCQRQVVKSNVTFNAFLMSEAPQLSREIIPVSMTRQLALEDDMKEYWGFYLLEGSVVTVSTCVRWPGASLIMIRGHRHLKECAYIGDDSSEELEEIMKLTGEKSKNKTVDQPSNRPKNMTRHLSGVRFHEPRPPALKTDSDEKFHTEPHDEEKDVLDPKVLQLILSELKEKTQNRNKKNRDPFIRPNNIVSVQRLTHRYRETNVNEDEEKWLSFKDLEEPDSVTETPSIKDDLSKTVKNQSSLEAKIAIDERVQSVDNSTNNRNIASDKVKANMNPINDTTSDKVKNNSSRGIKKDGLNSTNFSQIDDDVFDEQSSSELFEDMYNKLEKMGNKGKGVLERLNSKLSNISNDTSIDGTEINETIYKNENTTIYSDEDSLEEIANQKIEALKKLLIDVLNEEIKAKKDRQTRRKQEKLQRLKRELFLDQKFDKMLTEDDEKGNAAIEDEFEPDGIADHHVRLNESTLNDMSKSEFWSSFSSSEEALLECDGLILNLPLTPNKQCEASEKSVEKHTDISRSNTVTYRVPTNGYYFFVFNSENEIQVNYIRVKFDLKKTIYDLNKGKVMECKNSTGQCSMPLDFFSKEKVVFEVPVGDNDSLWNEDFVVISECEPRTLIYILSVVAIPIFIIMMALH